MKNMVKLFQKNKTFYILLLILMVSFVVGCLYVSFLDQENKEIIKSCLIEFFNSISKQEQNYKSFFIRSLGSNFILNLLVWVFGISIIGIPVVLMILFFKGFVFGFTYVSFIYNYKFLGLLYGSIYILPYLINILTLFYLTYYSVKFSMMIFNYFFRKKEYNKTKIVTRYFKILGACMLMYILSSVLEVFLVPSLLKLFL